MSFLATGGTPTGPFWGAFLAGAQLIVGATNVRVSLKAGHGEQPLEFGCGALPPSLPSIPASSSPAVLEMLFPVPQSSP
jgi:hypothetical protein